MCAIFKNFLSFSPAGVRIWVEISLNIAQRGWKKQHIYNSVVHLLLIFICSNPGSCENSIFLPPHSKPASWYSYLLHAPNIVYKYCYWNQVDFVSFDIAPTFWCICTLLGGKKTLAVTNSILPHCLLKHLRLSLSCCRTKWARYAVVQLISIMFWKRCLPYSNRIVLTVLLVAHNKLKRWLVLVVR